MARSPARCRGVQNRECDYAPPVRQTRLFFGKIHRRLEAVAARIARPQISDATLTEPLGPFRHDQCAAALGAARELTGTLGRCRVHGLDRHYSLLADFFSFLLPPRRKLPPVCGRDATLG